MIGDTSEVNKYPKGASQYGILDLAGNVSEWIADWYDEKYYETSPAKNPTGPATGQTRVLRGGAWDFPVQGLRAAQRQGANPLIRAYNVGFRCVTN
jgi:formylglycine-generating enzyme required for sulfatase activity